jgi:sigma-E factor negative regulatory protein RseB
MRIIQILQFRTPLKTLRWVNGLAVLIMVISPATRAETREITMLLEDERSPDYWIEKMSSSLLRENYRGVFTLARGRQFSSLEVDHRFRDGVVQEQLTQLNGPLRRVVREGDHIRCFHESENASLNHAVLLGPFSQSFNALLEAESDNYNVKVVGLDRVAGREAVMLAVQPSVNDRFGFMLWLDRNKGLLLQSHLVDRGRILEILQFATIEFDVTSALEDTDLLHQGWAVHSLSEEVLTSNEEPTFKVKWMPRGYRVVSANKDRIHFSDGVSDFSVFVEQGRELPKLSTEIEGRSIVTRPLRGRPGQITIVGALPLQTAERLAESVEPIIF